VEYILKNKNRNEEAFEYFKICYEILKDKSEKNITLLIEIYIGISNTLQNLGKHDQSLEWGDMCLDISLKKLGPTHLQTEEIYLHMGSIYYIKSEYDRAEACFFKSLKYLR